jgi:hypothetical protein
MAGQKLEPMSVNAGDPITAELMQNIIANINTVNSLSTNTTTSGSTGGSTAGSTGGYGAPSLPSVFVMESNTKRVSCKKDSTGESGPIYFNKAFSKTPNISLTVMNTGKNITGLKYLPVITSATATEFEFTMLSLSAASEGTLTVNWTASTT